MKKYITVYTKEHGKLEFTEDEWNKFDVGPITYHRIDGPAVEYADGDKGWWIDDKKYWKEDFLQITEEVKSLPLELRLTDPRWWVREIKQ
jgi:hypothetical protein